MAISLRSLLDRRVISVFMGLYNHLVLVANPGSGIQAHVLLLVISAITWPEAVPFSGSFGLLEHFRLWDRVGELL